MKNAFLKNSETYHSNLIHGLLLALSKMIDSLSSSNIIEIWLSKPNLYPET